MDCKMKRRLSALALALVCLLRVSKVEAIGCCDSACACD